MKIRSLVVVCLFALFVPVAALAQPEQTSTDQSKTQMDQKGGAPTCQQMMEKMRATHQQIQQMEQKLDELVAKMNSAQGQAKVDAMAEVINQMAAEHKVVREAMKQGPMMMQHMCSHMGKMMGKSDKDMKSCCPMMGGKMDGQTSAPASGAMEKE